jgi:pilus assembly protein Flp/PilA
MLQQTWMFMRLAVKDERGAAAIEYGLLAALIGVAFFAGAQVLGGSLSNLFTNVGNFVNSVVPLGGAN